MGQNPFAALIARNFGATSLAAPQMGNKLDLWTSARHGRDYNTATAKAVGMAANQSGVTTSAGLATTYVGLCLSNPAGSGKNLELLEVSGGFIVAPSTITGINLIVGFVAGGVTVHTTPITPLQGYVGDATALVGLVDSACTIVGTPAYVRPLAQCPVATSSPFFSKDIGGSIVIPPGGYVAIGTTIAGPASGFMGGFLWAEA